MKKVFFLSLTGTVIVTVLLLMGKIELFATVNDAITKGNQLYIAKDYAGAKIAYTKGLKAGSTQSILHYNLGLTAYALGDFEGAVAEFNEVKDVYLHLGNAYYRQGSQTEDKKEQLTLYQQSLEQYLAGIKVAPGDIELKFNYEYLKKIIDEMTEQNQEEQNQEEQNQEEQNQDGQESTTNAQGQDGQESTTNAQGQDGQESTTNAQGQDGQESTTNAQGQDGQATTEQGTDASGNPTQQSIDEKTIEQILKVLEQQEEESLKNNQTVIEQGKEDTYDW